MSTPVDPAYVVRSVSAGVSRLVVGELDDEARERQLDDLAALYGERTDVRHPFAPAGDAPMYTRAELRAHFAGVGGRTAGIDAFAPVREVVHRTADAEVVIYEFAYSITAHGVTSEVPCVFVVRVRDGCIVESRDYADHLGMARAVGQLDAALAAARR